jgi:hypothetical protein
MHRAGGRGRDTGDDVCGHETPLRTTSSGAALTIWKPCLGKTRGTYPSLEDRCKGAERRDPFRAERGAAGTARRADALVGGCAGAGGGALFRAAGGAGGARRSPWPRSAFCALGHYPWAVRQRETLGPLGLARWRLVAGGAIATGLRAHMVAGPVLDFRYYGPVEGRIVGIDRSASDALRLTLDRVRLDDVSPERTPRRVRVSLHGDQRWLHARARRAGDDDGPSRARPRARRNPAASISSATPGSCRWARSATPARPRLWPPRARQGARRCSTCA